MFMLSPWDTLFVPLALSKAGGQYPPCSSLELERIRREIGDMRIEGFLWSGG